MKALARWRLGAIVAVTLAAAGCLTKPAMIPQSFSIDPPAPRNVESPGGVVLAVDRVEIAPPYSGQHLVYQTGEHEFARDPYARFVAPPSSLLTGAIRGYLANADFVRDVVAAGGRARPVAVVEVAVRDLSGDLRSGGSAARLALRIRVISGSRAREGSEILLKTYSRAVSIPRATASAVVDGWNQGLAEVMAEFQSDLRALLTGAGLLSSSDGSPGGVGALVARN